mmetsp:Transcript_68293/g.162855  ORF Transcript_68293/g.162855 Transcript_68293/m.162855 type:complete len:360 (-) Transcript_68293:146-1225(-)
MLQEPDDALAKVKRDVVVDEVASQQSELLHLLVLEFVQGGHERGHLTNQGGKRHQRRKSREDSEGALVGVGGVDGDAPHAQLTKCPVVARGVLIGQGPLDEAGLHDPAPLLAVALITESANAVPGARYEVSKQKQTEYALEEAVLDVGGLRLYLLLHRLGHSADLGQAQDSHHAEKAQQADRLREAVYALRVAVRCQEEDQPIETHDCEVEHEPRLAVILRNLHWSQDQVTVFVVPSHEGCNDVQVPKHLGEPGQNFQEQGSGHVEEAQRDDDHVMHQENHCQDIPGVAQRPPRCSHETCQPSRSILVEALLTDPLSSSLSRASRHCTTRAGHRPCRFGGSLLPALVRSHILSHRLGHL